MLRHGGKLAARIVDEHVDAPELSEHRVDELDHLLGHARVASLGEHVDTHGGELSLREIELLLLAPANGDFGA